jgi:hypothetical protein
MENQKTTIPVVLGSSSIFFTLNLMGVALFQQITMTGSVESITPSEQEYNSYPLWTFIAFAFVLEGFY